MDNGQLRTMLRRLSGMNSASEPGGVSDAELLERFAARHDEAAFEVLIWRHGKMVMGVCRRILRNFHNAEDAFQATFLTLVRKARSIRNRKSLGAWLYQVAYRIALHSRARAATHARHEEMAPMAPDTLPNESADWSDLRPVLDEEINRLPDKYRRAVILCYLEGRTTEEAANQLVCPRGTILSRLAKAREQLRQRLSRRGVAFSATLLATVIAENDGFARRTGTLVKATMNAVFQNPDGYAAGVISKEVFSLTQGVLKAMFMTKVKIGATAMMLLAVLGMGANLWLQQPASADPSDAKRDAFVKQNASHSDEKTAKAREALRPVGDWERDIGPVHLTLHLDNDRIRAVAQIPEERDNVKTGKTVDLVMDFDYCVSKDSMLYGVLTSIELKGAWDQNVQGENELETMRQLTDTPFCFRVRIDDNVLTIKDFKFASNPRLDKAGIARTPLFIAGPYKRQAQGSGAHGTK